ncbi:MAG: adenylyl-sulfate kinase, partial [Thermoproteota archaeon]
PENPELTLNTAEDTPEQCTKAIIEKMKELALITG